MCSSAALSVGDSRAMSSSVSSSRSRRSERVVERANLLGLRLQLLVLGAQLLALLRQLLGLRCELLVLLGELLALRAQLVGLGPHVVERGSRGGRAGR